MMNRKTVRSLLSGAGLAILFAGTALAQTPNFTKYVALGDSFAAGYSAGCLVERNQRFSYPATLAKQFGIADFQQPTVSDPGIPVCTGLKSLVPVTFGPISTTKTGAPTNATLARSYDNLAIPNTKAGDVSGVTSSADPPSATCAACGSLALADLILRGKGSQLTQALSLNPTFITLGIHGNDVLTAAGAGFLLDGVTATPLPVFTANYNALAAALKASGRTGVFLGTPDGVHLLPLTSTLPPVLLGSDNKPVIVGGAPVSLLGPRTTSTCTTAPCPLPAGTLVTLGANAPQAALGGKSLLALGFGIPCNAPAPYNNLPQCGKPLPDGGFSPPATVNVGVLLYPDEIAAADQRVKDMNAVIKTAAESNGFKYFDFYAFSVDFVANGRTYGGIKITKDFVTGGMFAYGDAVHLSNIGYTILADELIQFINSSYGTSVPRPDMSVVLFTPDVPAPGTTGIGATVDSSIFFTEDTWKAFFDEFPLQDASMKLAFPVDTDGTPDRAPVVLPGRRSARD
jgi:hypothetical protein